MRGMRATLLGAKQETKRKEKEEKSESKRLEAANTFVESASALAKSKLLRHHKN